MYWPRDADRRTLTRRAWLERMLAAGITLPVVSHRLAEAASTSGRSDRTKWSVPGLFPGRVVAARHENSIAGGAFQSEPIQQTIRRGMMELTGAPDWIAAWRMFFQRGETVGIKLNPASRPYLISSPAVVREIVLGLEMAGIRRGNIVAYDRYRAEFFDAGFDQWLPEGVRISWASESNDGVQLDLTGYDPDQFMEMQLTLPGIDLADEQARRSHASLFVSREVDKVVNLCVPKQHQTAGISCALKNLSNGMVNNVARSHSTAALNACGAFIPSAVSIPAIRDKAVLTICDGVKALYNGGPVLDESRTQFIWENKTIYLATDPVALDRIVQGTIDQKRVAAGLLPVGVAQMDDYDYFVRMQPEHFDIAGAVGLGVSDRTKIELREIHQV